MTYPVFATGDVLNASDMNAVGLWKVAMSTFSGSSGVEIQNCFSSDYENYLLLVNHYGSSASNIQLQYMTGTNTKDTAATYNRTGWYWITSINNFNQVNTTSDFLSNHTTTATQPSSTQLWIYQPNQAEWTNSQLNNFDPGAVIVFCSYTKKTTSQYTGLYIFPSAGTMTGTATVYGARQ